MRPVARDHAVRRPVVLDLEHDPLIGRVDTGPGLRDQPVQPGPLELAEPFRRGRVVHRRRGQVNGRRRRGQRRLKRGPPLAERQLHIRGVAQRQQVERDEVGRRLRRQQPHSALGRVQPQLQRLEVQPPAVPVRQHDLAVDHAAGGQLGEKSRNELGEVAGHRPLVPAADLHLVAVAEDDRPEPVPLRLEDKVARRDRVHRLGQHRGHGRHHRKVHTPQPVTPARWSNAFSQARSRWRCAATAVRPAPAWQRRSAPAPRTCRSSHRRTPPPRATWRSTARSPRPARSSACEP